MNEIVQSFTIPFNKALHIAPGCGWDCQWNIRASLNGLTPYKLRQTVTTMDQAKLEEEQHLLSNNDYRSMSKKKPICLIFKHPVWIVLDSPIINVIMEINYVNTTLHTVFQHYAHCNRKWCKCLIEGVLLVIPLQSPTSFPQPLTKSLKPNHKRNVRQVSLLKGFVSCVKTFSHLLFCQT